MTKYKVSNEEEDESVPFENIYVANLEYVVSRPRCLRKIIVNNNEENQPLLISEAESPLVSMSPRSNEGININCDCFYGCCQCDYQNERCSIKNSIIDCDNCQCNCNNPHCNCQRINGRNANTCKCPDEWECVDILCPCLYYECDCQCKSSKNCCKCDCENPGCKCDCKCPDCYDCVDKFFDCIDDCFDLICDCGCCKDCDCNCDCDCDCNFDCECPDCIWASIVFLLEMLCCMWICEEEFFEQCCKCECYWSFLHDICCQCCMDVMECICVVISKVQCLCCFFCRSCFNNCGHCGELFRNWLLVLSILTIIIIIIIIII